MAIIKRDISPDEDIKLSNVEYVDNVHAAFDDDPDPGASPEERARLVCIP